MKRKVAEKKPGLFKKNGSFRRKPAAKDLPEHIYDIAALSNLRFGLRRAARRQNLPTENGDGLLWRLSGPLKALDDLYQLTRAMLAGDSKGLAAFRQRVLELADHAPQGGVRMLRQRAGLIAIETDENRVQPDRREITRAAPKLGGLPGLDCSVILPEGMAVLYLATLQAGLGEKTQTVIDTLATLSIEQGRMERLSGALAHGGLVGLEEQLQGGGDGDILGLGQLGGGAGYQPDPGNPFGPDDPWGGWNEGGGRWQPPAPDRDSCQGIRESCEALFIEQANAGLPPIPMPPVIDSSIVWSDKIDSIKMLGQCAGDRIIIHGHDFGVLKPPNIELVMNVDGDCAVVQSQSWSDTRIEAILPDGINSSSVGFYNKGRHNAEIRRYNHEVRTFNSGARAIMAASKCMGQPMNFDLFKPIIRASVPCAPESEHNFIIAGLPVIHYFIAATNREDGPTIVADPDDEIVLKWNIDNADVLSLTSSTNSTGPVIVPIEQASSSLELGALHHSQMVIFYYRIRATNVCGSKEALVKIVGSKYPGLAIQRIEVTQGIQTFDADVQLVADKATVVRTYITHALDGFGEDEVKLVKGSLSVYSSNGLYKGSFSPVNGVPTNLPDPPLPDINASITVQDLGNPPPPGLRVNDTLNFVIPASLCTETLDLQVSVHVDSFGPPNELGFRDSVSAEFEDFTFWQRKPGKLRFIPATIDTIDPAMAGQAEFIDPFANPPTDEECVNFLREMLKLLPVTASSIERLEGYSITFHFDRIEIHYNFFGLTWSHEIPSMWSEALRDYDIAANVYTYLLGVLRLCELGSDLDICTEDTDAIWVVLVPVNVWGRANGIPGREFIAPMNDISCAHELAHCLNQQHLTNTGCSGNNPFSGGDPITDAANWGDFDGGRILEEKAVPFDVIRNVTMTNAADGVWDLMTYCPTRWPTPRRWKLIFDYVGGS